MDRGKKGTTAPLQNAVLENTRALSSAPLDCYGKAGATDQRLETEASEEAFQDALEVNKMMSDANWEAHEMSSADDPFTDRLLSYWQYLREVYWEQDWDLTKVLNEFRAVPTMDWVYGMGYSSLDERGQLRVRALNLINTVSTHDDWRSNWRLHIIFSGEALEIVNDPLFPTAFASGENDRVKEIESIAAEFPQPKAA